MFNAHQPVLFVSLAPHSPEMAQMQKSYIRQKASSPGGFLPEPGNPKAKATGPRNIHLSWDPPPGNPTGYKVCLSTYYEEA